MLASGSKRGTHLWDINAGERLQKITSHRPWTSNVAFSPDSQILASGAEKDIHLWKRDPLESPRGCRNITSQQ